MNETNRRKSLVKKLSLKSVIKLLLGGALGAIAYIVVARVIVDQTDVSCSTGYLRSLVEGSTFLASLLVQSMMLTTSSYYQPFVLLLSSIPYAILGALMALKVNKIIVFVAGLLTVFILCLSGLLWAFFMAAICA
jgi:hypothetical protein